MIIMAYASSPHLNSVSAVLVTFYFHAFPYIFKTPRHLFSSFFTIGNIRFNLFCCFRIHGPIYKKPSTSCTKIASCTTYVLVIKRSSVCFPENTQKCGVKTTHVRFLLHHNSSCINNFWCCNGLSVGVRSSLQHTISIQGSNTHLNHCMT